jgi:adenine-specific DNA-methyltransferase
MSTELPERLDLRSQDIAGEKVADLLDLFPEVRTEDGQIDFERLKLILGEAVDIGKERYGLTWPGKADCFKTIQNPSLGTLLPAPEESVNWDSTENLIIEGDNLEVLKLLQKSYLGKVKMIYIDPPYNTGNDFIYPDDFSESLKTYLKYTGQVDTEGRRFSTNTDTDGRFHSKWLSMMYPRLYLARNLLRDDGLIFISIDDEEIDNLLKLCEEIFGEVNHVATLVHQRAKGGGQATHVVRGHDYIVAFARDIQMVAPLRRDKVVQGRREIVDGVEYLIDDDVVRKKFGKYDRALGDRRCFYEELVQYKGQAKKDEIDALLKAGQLFLERREDGRHVICRRTPIAEATSKLYSIVKVLSEEGKSDLAALGLEGAYDYPKPVELGRQLVRASSSRGETDIVLDFFAGSGTTAHAVLDLNKQDDGNRRFILVQLPEPTQRDDYPTIADIAKERVRRVVDRLNREDRGGVEMDRAVSQDRGFRVFKLAESNFRVWEADVPHQLEALMEQLELHVGHVTAERTSRDVLFEILLKSGFPLTTSVESIAVGDTTVYSVGEGALLVWLDGGLTLEAVRGMADREPKPERIVFLDAGFGGDDQLKANAAQLFKTRDIVFRTV